MLQRLYVHNFRCLENFELILKEMPSSLLIGKNGAGKSTIRVVLEILQHIGRGINRMRDFDKNHLGLIDPKDFNRGRSDVPIRFEIEVLLDNKLYKYILALELPENFRELRVFEEQLLISGNPIYSRKEAQVTLYTSHSQRNLEAQFLVDWHLVALPVIQEQSETDPLRIFKTWLARTIILAPIPSLMTGDSNGETLEPKRDGSNFGEWFSGLLSRYPAAYTQAYRHLQEVMPDFQDFLNEQIGKDSKSMIVRFEAKNANLSVDFKDLSDGEKCFFLCAVVLAANKYYGPLFCFWDEPDNYLSLSEVGHFVTSLRRSFKDSGQIVATSHNEEAIRKFSNENTFVLDRKSHLEPTLVRLLGDIPVSGDLVDTLIRGDIEL
ncbi:MULTISPECIES: AAA family ATPase [unclassified Microcoleus]|uniref:AAA family ATPase n=1 Tax=unclassified Microcoleus TaxID=2642155 RepID=UPI0025F24A11|nr:MULTISPECIES: AAA family ATPase [unclassified Microcoleus]